nr:MAG TPA: hypothetical protein [Caudoviricetes sp.]
MGCTCNKYYTNNIHKIPFIYHTTHIFGIIACFMFTYLTLHFYDKYYFQFSVNIILKYYIT